MHTELDIARDSIAMNAILNERDNADIAQQQENLRNEMKIKGKQNKERIDNIRKEQSELRTKFIDLNDFIRDCKAKETLAHEKILHETAIKDALEQDIIDLEGKIGNLEMFHDKFKISIDDLMSYENVLNEVVQKMELFKSKDDFLDRCDALCML